jgi:hypothetical protein
MKRIIKTGAIAAIAAVAATGVIGTATGANAAVSVNEAGVGTVGKGDVQDVLDWDNHDFDQNVKDVTFTVTYSKMADHTLKCGTYVPGPGIVQTGTVRLLITTPVTQTVDATQVLNSNGKQITGWNLTGGTATDGPAVREGGICPTGSFDIGTATMSFYDSPHVLKVNGVDLPNTPIV